METMDTEKLHAMKLQALNLLRGNRLAEAQALFSRICELNADDVDAWYFLSCIHGMQGQLDEAGQCCRRIIALQSNHSDAHVNLGNVLFAQGKPEEAVLHYETAVRNNPNNAGALYSLGNALSSQGKHSEAIFNYQAALRLNPNFIEAYYSLGNSQMAKKEYGSAMDSFRNAIRLNPNYLDAREKLNKVLEFIDKEPMTLPPSDKSTTESMPNSPQEKAIQYYNQGVIAESQGKHAEAITHYQQAISMKSDFAEAYNNLGALLMWQGRREEALLSLQKTVELQPNSVHGLNNLGNLLRKLGRLDEATTSIQKAIRLDPSQPEPYINLAMTHIDQGQVRACVELLQQQLDVKPDNMNAASSLIFSMHYLPDYSAENLFKTAEKYAARFNTLKSHPPSPENIPDPLRRLRIGYVSADFYNHPVGYFIEQVLSRHDRSMHDVFCYYNQIKHDDMTVRLQKSCDHWRSIMGQSDTSIAQIIREDNIDILIDLSGHTSGNRLQVFAYKPAPIQVTWLGYFDTTGMNAMDYIIGDRFLIPSEEERHYTEQVLRLPNAYLCFSPPDVAIYPNPLPSLASGKITFGCFNNPAKITDRVISCWSRLLHALPLAQLHLQYASFDDASVRQRFLELFVKQGIASECIQLSGVSPRHEYLAAYHEIDIGLDPFPFNGCTITMESLWMGVPVVTLRGDRYVGHMGETILKNLGLPECVTDSEEAYIDQAIALASNPKHLAKLRSGLRDRLLNSPLCDGPGFARDLEAAYRQMWKTWCQTQPQTD